MTAPLLAADTPAAYDLGVLGKVYVTGQASALGMTQNNPSLSPLPGNEARTLDLSNAQVEAQTTAGLVQFYLEAGAYDLPTLGAPYVRTSRTMSETYGAVPIGYLKAAPFPDVSVQIGSLPTLIGAEYTFTFQNMNIERGLLWSQEPAISRGVQLNYSHGPVLVSASLNDGFYSGRYTWASGLASYAINAANTLILAGGANLAHADTSSFATPLPQNNSRVLNVIYTYSKGALLINPYVQLTRVQARPVIGLMTSASTASAAVLAKYSLSPSFSLAARTEYLRQSDGACQPLGSCAATNLAFGPKSAAWSNTLTPTYQRGRYFARAEVSSTRIGRLGPGSGFGRTGNDPSQTRALIECGALF